MSTSGSTLTCHCGTKFDLPSEVKERRVNCPTCGAVIFLAAPKAEAEGDDEEEYGIKSHDEDQGEKSPAGVEGIPDWLENYRSDPDVKKGERDKTLALIERLAIVNPTLDPLGATLFVACSHADAETSVAALTKVAASGHPIYAPVANQLLPYVGPDDANGARQVLLLMNEAKDAAAEQVVAKVLRSLGPTPVVRVRELIDLLGSRHMALYAWAVQCLKLIGPPAKRSVDALLKSLKIANQPFRLIVIDALGAIGADAERVLPVLLQALKHESPEFRAHGAQALGRFGIAATKALPQLKEVVNDADEQVRHAAAKALELITAAGHAPATGAAAPAPATEAPQNLVIVCSCGKRLKAKPEFAGKKVKCPACGVVVVCPAPKAPPATPDAPVAAGAASLPEKECPTCMATVPGAAVLCVCCGHDFRAK